MFCTSMTGEKSELFVVGKSKCPRYFQHVKKLPARYRANANAIFRRDICRLVLEKMDEAISSSGVMSVAKSITLLVSTVLNCWIHSRLKGREREVEEQDFGMRDVSIKTDEFLTWSASVDHGVNEYQPLTEKDIVRDVLHVEDSSSDSNDDENMIVERPVELPSAKEVCQALNTIKMGLQGKTNYDFKNFIRFERTVDRVIGNSFRQETIDNFLNK